MTVVRIAPSIMVNGLQGADLVALTDDLQRAGFTATLDNPEGQREERSAGGAVALYIGIYLAERVGEAVLTKIAALVVKHLKGKRKQMIRVPLYGPNEEVLRIVEVPGKEEG